jgi:hypothetical protein
MWSQKRQDSATISLCGWEHSNAVDAVPHLWRDGRVVEGAALEMLFRGNFNEGSNPSLSVLSSRHTKTFREPLKFQGLFFGRSLG